MNEYFEENKRSLILLAGMLFILALVLFFVLLRPLMNEYKSEQKRIEDLQNEIELLEAQINNLKDTSDDVDLEQLILENKVPRERELDEYILSLQQLELHTESKIESIDFAYDSSFDVDEVVEEETEDNADTEDTAEIDTDEEMEDAEEATDDSTTEETTEPTIDPVILSEKPEQLQVMTIRVSAVVPDFDELIELLKIIESSERLSIVTSLNFTKPTEQDLYFSDNPSSTIPFEAELMTFYYKE